MNTYFLIALMFGMSLSMFLLIPGMSNTWSTFANIQTPADAFTLVFNAIFSAQGLLSIVTILALGLITSFNFQVLVPFALISVVMNILIAPNFAEGSVLANSLPQPIGFIIYAFFNITLFLIVISFIRSG